MSDIRSLDKKKLAIMVIPLIIAAMIYFVFIEPAPQGTKPQASGSIPIPDSDAEDLPTSKTEIYKKVREQEKESEREKTRSQISSEVFYRLGSEPEIKSAEEPDKVLDKNESIKKIEQLLSQDLSETNKITTNRWSRQEVADPLARYDAGKKTKLQQQRIPDTLPKESAAEKPEGPVHKPERRSRNNRISDSGIYSDGNLITAAIHSDQTITNGGTVKMRLLQEIWIDGQKIPENTFFYGIARFSNERVIIKTESIRIDRTIIPFDKSIVDKDGLEGLYFPVNLQNQMGTEISNDGIDELYARTRNHTGVIGDILSAGKSVLKRKNSEKKVTLKANYNIYLK